MSEERTYTTEQELVDDGWEIIGREDLKPGVVRLSSRKLSTVPALFRMDYVDAPVRDAAESAKIVRVDDCLASVLASAECDCIPNEFQCVKHGAMDELNALRARVASLEGEIAALRTDRELQRGYIADVREEARAARALLAVERERVIEECAKVCDRGATGSTGDTYQAFAQAARTIRSYKGLPPHESPPTPAVSVSACKISDDDIAASFGVTSTPTNDGGAG